MSRHPEVKWAQRSDKLYITIELPDAINPKCKLEPEGKFTFSATAGKDKTPYELDFDLYDRVNIEASKINVGLRNIFCVVQKEQKAWWKRLLKSEGKRLPYLKVDWNMWVDEDEEEVSRDMDFGNMDFSKLDMGDDELDNDYEPGEEAGLAGIDEDDELSDEETAKTESAKVLDDEETAKTESAKVLGEETAQKEPVKEEPVAAEPAHV